jgi:hypothetical protein
MDQSNNSLAHSNFTTDLNRTELYQLCRRAGRNVHPAWEREELVAALMDTLEVDAGVHPVDALRDSLIAFIQQHWRTLRPQLRCPAKDLDHPDPNKINHRPCFGCSDMQVVTCVSTQGPANQQRIMQLRKTK